MSISNTGHHPLAEVKKIRVCVLNAGSASELCRSMSGGARKNAQNIADNFLVTVGA
jgi:hypothetical protein